MAESPRPALTQPLSGGSSTTGIGPKQTSWFSPASWEYEQPEVKTPSPPVSWQHSSGIISLSRNRETPPLGPNYPVCSHRRRLSRSGRDVAALAVFSTVGSECLERGKLFAPGYFRNFGAIRNHRSCTTDDIFSGSGRTFTASLSSPGQATFLHFHQHSSVFARW
jgi:hypothetical protein